jgi:septum formation protein
MPAGEAALTLARAKASAVAEPGALVISADQILVCGETWYDKPVSLADARDHLASLCGKTHILHTACVARCGDTELFAHLATPRLTMRAFTGAFLEAYLAAEGEALLGCVGAYRLEGRGIHLFDHIEGDHTAILGLPMLPLLAFLRTSGIIAD